ncbi:hypothetical protein A0H81_01259 [Grifola frondosa]|uniref:Uncharacterized protein n=1 Tax=Grifola frondosa TaxID=5627 RepID=A0A1C7MNV8_GRIFR|nr:hypothetical protein A0H81_01259 [Grifola frondosa]
MERRGRSRDVSPIAIARRAQQRHAHSPSPISAIPQSSQRRPPPPHDLSVSAPSYCRPPSPVNATALRHATMLYPAQPIASSSRLPSPPTASSSRSSTSPNQTSLEPLTPPEYAYDESASLDYYLSPPPRPAPAGPDASRGIEVTGDDDPRIAAVTDDDFNSSFIPPGGLPLREEDELRVREHERRAREARRRREREERLRACERVWEGSARCLREEKARATRRREEEARERRRLELEAREREKEKERERERERARDQELSWYPRQLRIASGNQRQLLCYDSLRDARYPQSNAPTVQGDGNDTFLYCLMPSPPSRPSSLSSRCDISPPDQHTLTLPRARHELAMQSRSSARSVPFVDVVASMHGSLFPVGDSGTPSYARRNAKQVELFESLFEAGDWEEDNHVEVKGNGGEHRLKDAGTHQENSKSTCVACSLRSSSSSSSIAATSSSASTITRSGSWFSFSSRSSRLSVSTLLTTPSTSPQSSSIKSPPQSSAPLPTSTVIPVRHSCRYPHFTSTPTTEHPLVVPIPSSKRAPPLAVARGRQPTRQSAPDGAHIASGLVRRVSESVSTLVGFAAQLQRAYVKATMFSVGADMYSRSRSDSRSRSRSPSRSPLRTRTRGCRSGAKFTPYPEGYRADAADVRVFMSLLDDLCEAPLHILRPLVSLSSAESQTLHPRVFPAPPPLPRSPFRPPLPPTVLLSRLRPVGNPVLLRLQALQNICAGRAVPWEGRPREGRMCAGKEKMLGVAWEGIGRSGLGWEVRFVC